MRVFIDTSFLLACVERRVDFLSEFERLFPDVEPVVVSPVMDELERFVLKKNKRGFTAKLAVDILKRAHVRVIRAEGYADDVLAAVRGDVVATMDAGLKKRLRNKAKLVVLREKSHLEAV